MTTTEASFLAEPCYCGHTREQHRAPRTAMTVRCRTCTDGHYFSRPEQHERRVPSLTGGYVQGNAQLLGPVLSQSASGSVGSKSPR